MKTKNISIIYLEVRNSGRWMGRKYWENGRENNKQGSVRILYTNLYRYINTYLWSTLTQLRPVLYQCLYLIHANTYRLPTCNRKFNYHVRLDIIII